MTINLNQNKKMYILSIAHNNYKILIKLKIIQDQVNISRKKKHLYSYFKIKVKFKSYFKIIT